ncbi:bifunctional Nucleotidyltransferase superfamily/Zinc finger C2H2-type [Babesia duncani]|uniref:Bifunctional Nucleotidyltransferase superfamily/Zinc finger C2H2-type n=1 Tax=Babesia duncani TaxID=323732 RepID=A0AAD9UPP8_9APIC|nr:bifunctional Nucleotidyltransferase superfamily/Zinc finger C2H2-type [Babesia duncani]
MKSLSSQQLESMGNNDILDDSLRKTRHSYKNKANNSSKLDSSVSTSPSSLKATSSPTLFEHFACDPIRDPLCRCHYAFKLCEHYLNNLISKVNSKTKGNRTCQLHDASSQDTDETVGRGHKSSCTLSFCDVYRHEIKMPLSNGGMTSLNGKNYKLKQARKPASVNGQQPLQQSTACIWNYTEAFPALDTGTSNRISYADALMESMSNESKTPNTQCCICGAKLSTLNLNSMHANEQGHEHETPTCYACRARRTHRNVSDDMENFVDTKLSHESITVMESKSGLAYEDKMIRNGSPNSKNDVCSTGEGSKVNSIEHQPFTLLDIDAVTYPSDHSEMIIKNIQAKCRRCNKPHLTTHIEELANILWIQSSVGKTDLGQEFRHDDVEQLVTLTLDCTEEMLEHIVNSIKPSETSIKNKLYLYEMMERVLKFSLGEDTQICMAGSTSYDVDVEYSNAQNGTGCFSDLDVEVLSSSYTFNSRAILTRVYHDLCNMQRIASDHKLYNNWVLGNSKIKLVSTAKVPIVILSTSSGLVCDISVNVTNSLVHRDLIKALIAKHSLLRSFMRIIKHWIKLRGIPSMKRGGFPSVFWMVIFCNIVDCFENDKNENHTNADMRRSSMLEWLEVGFKLLANGRNLIEMVQVFSGSLSYDTLSNPEWKLGTFGRNFIHLIEMEASQPHGVWLVYYYELERAVTLFKQYKELLGILVSLKVISLYYQNCMGFAECKDILDKYARKHGIEEDLWISYPMSDSVMGTCQIQLDAIAKRMWLKLSTTRVQDQINMLASHVLQKSVLTIMQIFEETSDREYSIPAAIEPPLHLELVLGGFGHYSQISHLPESAKRLAGSMWLDSGWFIAIVQEKLAIVKVIKTCIHWSSWWSMDFTSRRDSKSVFHALVHQRHAVGSLFVLVRDGGVVLLNPSHIVSGIHVTCLNKVDNSFQHQVRFMDPTSGHDCVYLLPNFELDRILSFEFLVKSRSENIDSSACKAYLNKWIPLCPRCGARDCYDSELSRHHISEGHEVRQNADLTRIFGALEFALKKQPLL